MVLRRTCVFQCACEQLELRVLLSAGTLDPTFNGTGMLTLGALGDSLARDVVVQPDGKLVVVGERHVAGGGAEFAIARLRPDGTLDPSFDGNGVIELPVGDFATSVALQQDGKIVVAGYSRDKSGFDWPTVARFTSAGAFDIATSFNPGAFDDHCFDMAIQPDGKIVLVGTLDTVAPGGDKLFVARLHADIASGLDSSFDGDGIAILNIGQDTVGSAVAIQPDGRIVVAGNGPGRDWLFARYLASGPQAGQLDTSFGFGGYRLIDFVGGDDLATDVVLQPDGKVVMAGWLTASAPVGRNFLVARYLSNGLEDSPFGGGASARDTDFSNSDDAANSLTMQSDGKIVLAGQTNQGSLNTFAFVRYDRDGNLDASFGAAANGRVTVNFPGSSSEAAYGSTIDGDGRVIAVGVTTQSPRNFGIVRLLPGQFPYFGVPFNPQQQIEAEQYDNGGPGTAYSDTTPNANDASGPFGSSYRPSSGVDLETDSDGGNNVHVGYARAGEFLRYTVNVPASGLYDLQFRVASSGAGGTFHVEFNGTNVTGPISIPNTGGFLNFTSIQRGNVNLTAGMQTATIVLDTAGAGGAFVGNLNWWRFGDFTPPQAISNSFQFNDTPQRLVYQFSESVAASLNTTDLVLQNLTTGTTVPLGSIAVSYNDLTNTATFTFPGCPSGILPDGDYRATLNSAGVTDAAGNPLPADVVTNFFFVQSDANHDRRVNLTDFNIVAANFGQSNRTFSQGDFNYDTFVSLSDFNILASKFGNVLSGGSVDFVRVGGAWSAPRWRPLFGERDISDLLDEQLVPLGR